MTIASGGCVLVYVGSDALQNTLGIVCDENVDGNKGCAGGVVCQLKRHPSVTRDLICEGVRGRPKGSVTPRKSSYGAVPSPSS